MHHPNKAELEEVKSTLHKYLVGTCLASSRYCVQKNILFSQVAQSYYYTMLRRVCLPERRPLTLIIILPQMLSIIRLGAGLMRTPVDI